MAKLKDPPTGPIDEEATLMRLLKTPHKDHAPLKTSKSRTKGKRSPKPKKGRVA